MRGVQAAQPRSGSVERFGIPARLHLQVGVRLFHVLRMFSEEGIRGFYGCLHCGGRVVWKE